MTGNFIDRENQLIQLVKVLYCKLPTIGQQLPTIPHKVFGLNSRCQRWEASVLPQLHRGPLSPYDLIIELLDVLYIKLHKPINIVI